MFFVPTAMPLPTAAHPVWDEDTPALDHPLRADAEPANTRFSVDSAISMFVHLSVISSLEVPCDVPSAMSPVPCPQLDLLRQGAWQSSCTAHYQIVSLCSVCVPITKEMAMSFILLLYNILICCWKYLVKRLSLYVIF